MREAPLYVCMNLCNTQVTGTYNMINMSVPICRRTMTHPYFSSLPSPAQNHDKGDVWTPAPLEDKNQQKQAAKSSPLLVRNQQKTRPERSRKLPQ